MDKNNNKRNSKYKKIIALAIVIVMALSSFQIYETVTKPPLEISNLPYKTICRIENLSREFPYYIYPAKHPYYLQNYSESGTYYHANLQMFWRIPNLTCQLPIYRCFNPANSSYGYFGGVGTIAGLQVTNESTSFPFANVQFSIIQDTSKLSNKTYGNVTNTCYQKSLGSYYKDIIPFFYGTNAQGNLPFSEKSRLPYKCANYTTQYELELQPVLSYDLLFHGYIACHPFWLNYSRIITETQPTPH